MADQDLTGVRHYSVEHHKSVEFSKGGFTLFGLPLALIPEFEAMAIPTTLLVDETSVIRWIDQTDD